MLNKKNAGYDLLVMVVVDRNLWMVRNELIIKWVLTLPSSIFSFSNSHIANTPFVLVETNNRNASNCCSKRKVFLSIFLSLLLITIKQQTILPLNHPPHDSVTKE